MAARSHDYRGEEAGGQGTDPQVLTLPSCMYLVPFCHQGCLAKGSTLLPAVLPQDGIEESSMKGTWTLSSALPLVEAGLLNLERLWVTLQGCS